MSATSSLPLLIATLLMRLAGISKKHLEWKPRTRPRRPTRKPPTNADA